MEKIPRKGNRKQKAGIGLREKSLEIEEREKDPERGRE